MRFALLVGLLVVIAAPVLAQGDANNTTASGGNVTVGNSTANTTTNGTSNGTGNNTAPGPVEFFLEGHQDGSGTYWTLAGKTDPNPTLTVAPGQTVIFHVKAASGLHNFKVGDLKATAPFSDTDPQIDITWTAPTTPGSVTYICTIHGAAMSGTITVGTPSNGGGGGGGAGQINGASIDLADIKDKNGAPVYPQCAGKGIKVPAIVQDHVTGGPTLDDYAKQCSTQVATDPYKNVDFVVPISFALLGLGIVGIVWVHRSYKP